MPASRPQLARPADVRSAILSASVDLLEQEGVSALSMREVARRAGVSHQAPYHHFADKESILAALVADGFEDLALRLEDALARRIRGDRSTLLHGASLAYVRFAVERPGVFRIMFRSEMVDHARFPEAQASSSRAFAALQQLVTTLGGSGSVRTRTSLHWSVVHGLATLLVDGKLSSSFPSNAARLAHASDVLRTFASAMTSTNDADAIEKSSSARKELLR